MARTNVQNGSIQEWSCPMCTLLNAEEEPRCAACDNVRPPSHTLRASQHLEPSIAAATAPETQVIYRPSDGVFFTSLPRDQSKLDASSWIQEQRLVVNRRRGGGQQNGCFSAERERNRQLVETGTIRENIDFAMTPRHFVETSHSSIQAQSYEKTKETSIAVEMNGETQQEIEEEETEADVEVPCFNLLGPGAAVFEAPAMENEMKVLHTKDKTIYRDRQEEWDENAEASSPPQYVGSIPASNVHNKEPEMSEKLASAGLDFSNSDDDDDDEPKRFKRRKDDKKDSWEDNWVCQICTNSNDQILLECSSCCCKRHQNSVQTLESTEEPNVQWTCHVCTNVNPSNVAKCLVCQSMKETNAQALDNRWKCSLCATLNFIATTRCDVCDRVRDDQLELASENGRQCPVCTNINATGRARCELCDSSLPTEVANNHYVDLSSPSLQAKPSDVNDDVELDNPYADLSQYNDYDAPNEVADADPDYVEEISDNELSNSLKNSCPLIVRSELKEFKHFVCMEDLRRDYGCRINYTQMFAGQRSKKSYADRLATRQAQSRKRKQIAANKEAGEASRSKAVSKATKRGKKQKTTATSRRASESGAKALKPKRAKKSGVAARRASSTTTISTNVNHYDESIATVGEDVNMMAWEGVGAAGYL